MCQIEPWDLEDFPAYSCFTFPHKLIVAQKTLVLFTKTCQQLLGQDIQQNGVGNPKTVLLNLLHQHSFVYVLSDNVISGLSPYGVY